MHQHPRPPPRTASPASSPQTNPTRTNNPRDDESESGSRKRNSNLSGYIADDQGIGESVVPTCNGPSKDSIRKLDQIIQNFHIKAAILVLGSRTSLPIILSNEGTKKVNRWFQIETDDTTSFRQELDVWKQCGGLSDRPPPLIIETYIDASELSSNQRLVIFDESGKRWDVLEALNSSYLGEDRQPKIKNEVILERWKFKLQDPLCDSPYDFGSALPTVYKKLIVFFRSLYTTTKFVPVGRLVKMQTKIGPTGGFLKVNCRILNRQPPSGRFDALTYPIYDNGNIPVTTDYVLGTTETPVGQIFAEVSYRNDCNFRTDDSESLLSSRFMGADEQIFQPSLGIKGARGRSSTHTGDGECLPRSRPQQTSRNSITSLDCITMARRPSVSFQPFKAGSLSSSPGQTKLSHRGEIGPSTSSQSLPRTPSSNSSTQMRNRSSLTAGTPATLRGVPVPPENITHFPTSGSPRPGSVSKYSSSFNRRRAQFSGTPGKNAVDEDQNSSGKHNISSFIQNSSITLGEASSESLQGDDDNISEFLKVLDRQKTLKSFESSGDANAKRTSAQLSRYQSLRESHNALTESMTSSALLYRSSNSSSRQLSGIPPVTTVTSMSISSSPGKPVSPHTPHTPAIPSRLSANSIVEYTEQQKPSHRSKIMSETPPRDASDEQNIRKTNAAAANRCSISRSLNADEADDEPLLFQMSEIGRGNSRPSIDGE
ncbi:Autophagy-related protein 13 [Podosphaera aphanis]|nr:Autophagy-related protein 13 [Podosphaera aphanis]